jgi:Rod binding domain-containing protein
MTLKVAPAQAVGVPVPLAHVKAPVDPKIRQAAQEFEAMFVRQILKAAKIGGHEKENGYDGMAVDALATGVTQGGGMGLARQIEEALSHAGRQVPKK